MKTAMHCYQSHPALPLGERFIYGGNADHPVVKDAQVYLSLQEHSRSGLATNPWDTKTVVEAHYPIQDRGVPKNPKNFLRMIEWLAEQVMLDKKVHVGCIGGHGRTGLVLSALVAHMEVEKDAIRYVRENYCHKVVESKTQVDFLIKNFGVKTAKCTDTEWVSTPTPAYASKHAHSSFTPSSYLNRGEAETAITLPGLKPRIVTGTTQWFRPVASNRCLWKN